VHVAHFKLRLQESFIHLIPHILHGISFMIEDNVLFERLVAGMFPLLVNILSDTLDDFGLLSNLLDHIINVKYKYLLALPVAIGDKLCGCEVELVIKVIA